MTDFGGWDMPVQYPTGPREEHLRVRSAAGLFDIDHMGRFAVSGPAALDVLQGVQTWDASLISPGSAHYSLLCMDSGGIRDDIFMYRLDSSLPLRVNAKTNAQWLVIVNAGQPEERPCLAQGLFLHLQRGFQGRLHGLLHGCPPGPGVPPHPAGPLRR